MSFIGFISLGIAAALIAEPFVKSRITKNKRDKGPSEKFKRTVEHNLAHLPPKDIPQLSAKIDAAKKLIVKSHMRLYTIDGKRCYRDGDGICWIPDDQSGDTLKLVELVISDFRWFYNNPTGETVSEQLNILGSYMREKYGLSDTCVDSIEFLFGNYSVS